MLMSVLRRRKTSPADRRREQLRQARVDAPTLRQFLPAAAQVWVELTFDMDARLAPAPRLFTVYPPAQAHFVYACPFGDCDGTYDLNEAVFAVLRAGTCEATGVLHCMGRKARRSGLGLRCGLGVAYAVTVRYGAEQSRPPARFAPALTLAP
jgi:hypothetical protein